MSQNPDEPCHEKGRGGQTLQYCKFCKDSCTKHILKLQSSDDTSSCETLSWQYLKIKRLHDSAANGCPLCNFCYRQVLKGGHDDEDIRIKVTLFWRPSQILELFFDIEKNQTSTTLKLTKIDDATALSYGSARYGKTNDSTQGFDTIQKWIETCNNEHEHCCSPRPDRKLPSRLVGLGDGHSIQPKLCSTDSLPLNTLYTTLSHRWNIETPVILTKNSLEAMGRGIPTDQLTQTFTDAMKITKVLGCQYIWIDSLCIVQDDDYEWIHEGGKMSSVYQNSWCNIVSAKRNPQLGCFSRRGPLEIHPIIFSVPEVGDQGNSYLLAEPNIWHENFVGSRLLNRGWVVQELVLSPRNLFYGDTQAFWQCSAVTLCESQPLEITTHARDEWAAKITADPNMSEAQKLTLWNGLVERYSATKLSFPEKDKLLAISGLAQAIGIQGTYMAGIWKHSLPNSLMWAKKDGAPVKPSKYQAPSWSWAAINTQIKHEVFERRQYSDVLQVNGLTTVEDVHLKLKDTENEFGPVWSGELVARGPLLALRRQLEEERHENAEDSNMLGKLTLSEAFNAVDYTFDYEEKQMSYDYIYCLGLAQSKARDGFSTLDFLLLCADEDRGVFQRIGILKIYFTQKKKMYSALNQMSRFSHMFPGAYTIPEPVPPTSAMYKSRSWNEEHEYWDYQISIL